MAGWLYPVAVIDWYSRYVISWQLDDTLALPFILRVIDQALEQAAPAIRNGDQGSQFTHPAFTQRLLVTDVRISLFPAATPWRPFTGPMDGLSQLNEPAYPAP